MGFLDDALNKTKEVIDVACKKTDEIVTEEKLKINILSLKNKCEKDYIKLGEIYYKILNEKEEISDKEKKIIANIAANKKEIEKLQAELDGMHYDLICPKCQKKIPTNSTFCTYCGAKIG